jgi:hypothetical protein
MKNDSPAHRHYTPEEISGWVRRYRAGLQELKVTAGLPTPNWAVEIGLPTGMVARFTAMATPAWIHAVLEGLRRPC